jgi:uncharacterized protein YecE (DUF72 family)
VKNGKIYIGTSGWSNSSWKGIFYPDKMPSKKFLSHYATVFNASEVNSTFYHLPRITTIESWISAVPPDFKFCPKVSQFLTHMKKLKDSEEPMSRFINAILSLKGMLGPILIQLPPSLKFDIDVIEPFFDLLKEVYSEYAFAIEPRHLTWFEPDSLDLLRKYKITFAISESGGRFPYGEFVTAKNVYLRFHGAPKLYDSSYSDDTLKEYADKVKQWRKEGHDCWIFFNNTMHDSAIHNAHTIARFIGV